MAWLMLMVSNPVVDKADPQVVVVDRDPVNLTQHMDTDSSLRTLSGNPQRQEWELPRL